MERWVPYEKLSKKKQREMNAKKRGSWHGVNPVTRKMKNAKAYDRKKTRQRIDDPVSVSFCFSLFPLPFAGAAPHPPHRFPSAMTNGPAAEQPAAQPKDIDRISRAFGVNDIDFPPQSQKEAVVSNF